MKEKGRFLKKYRGNQCLNCDVPLDTIDKYCHNCGQINTTKKLAFSDFFEELFSSIFSYDSRLRHTILALLFYPGKISKDYVNGKRIKYANPFRFYLSVSIIFFIINGFFLDFDDFNNELTKNGKAENELIKTSKTDTTTANAENDQIAFIQLDYDGNTSTIEIYYSESQLKEMSITEGTRNRWETYKTHYTKTKETSASIALDSLSHKKNRYTKYMYKRAVKIEEITNNPKDLFKFFLNNLPLIIFLFLPFFALAIKLIYIRRDHTYMEHLVFTFHTQTMFFILMGIALLIDQITGTEITIKIATLIFSIYLYKAMRKFYTQTKGKTIVKFLLVNILFFILAVIGIIFSFFGSIFIF